MDANTDRDAHVSTLALLLLGLAALAFFAGLALLPEARAWGLSLALSSAGLFAAAGVVGVRRARL